MRIIFLLTAFLISLTNYAQIPTGYYNSANGLTGLPLKAALHEIIDNHTVKSYSSLHTHFQVTDVKSNGKVWDMYSDIPDGTPPYEFTFGNTCGNYSGENDCYNREHSWPQSWFNSASPMQSDLFHVYPTDGYVNGRRGNLPFGEADTATWTSMNGSKLGLSSFSGYSGEVFEPIDAYKGDLARTYFYMSVRYYTEDSLWQTTDMTAKSELKQWAINLLMKWSEEDTVSQKETDRNNEVYLIQNNRNPFIDHPEYIKEIWTSTLSLKNKNEESVFNIYPNPSNGIVNIQTPSEDVYILSILDCSGRLILRGEKSNGLFNLDVEAGVYFAIIQQNDRTVARKLIIR